MGGTTFATKASGKTMEAAFRSAIEHAQYMHGHAGYTGTIAEKHSYVKIAVPAGVKPADHARKLLDDDDPRVCDKWGPAGAIDCGEGQFLFFGWASS